MAKHKVSELSGAMLNAAVAKAEGFLPIMPGWGDNTRQVEIVNDGVHVVGELRIDDWGEAEGEEFPMFTVRDAAGKDHSFAGSDKWRFLS